MSADDRFKPPAARVADVAVATSRGAVIALGIAGALQFCWLAATSRTPLILIEKGALMPIGLVFAVAGEACLCVAIVRMVWLRRRPRRTFGAAIASLTTCCCLWHSLPSPGFLGPLALGVTLAGIGLKFGRDDASAAAAGG